MKTISFAAGLTVLAVATPALADAPKFAATCPNGIEVTSNGNGKIRIDGKKAAVKKMSSTAWQARRDGTTVDIGRDGSKVFVSVSPNGDVCEVMSSRASGNSDGSIGGVSQTDQSACLTAVSRKTNNNTVKVLDATSSEANNNVTVGVGAAKAKWQCLVKNGKVADVMSLSDEGGL